MQPNCFLAVELRVNGVAPKDVEHVTVTRQSRDQAETRVQLQRAMSQRDRLGQSFAGRWVILLHSPEIKIIGSEVLRSPPRCHFNFRVKQLRLDGRNNGDRHFVLKSEDVCQVALEPVRPYVSAR